MDPGLCPRLGAKDGKKLPSPWGSEASTVPRRKTIEYNVLPAALLGPLRKCKPSDLHKAPDSRFLSWITSTHKLVELHCGDTSYTKAVEFLRKWPWIGNKVVSSGSIAQQPCDFQLASPLRALGPMSSESRCQHCPAHLTGFLLIKWRKCFKSHYKL